MSGAYEDERAARVEWLERVGPVSRSLARTEQRYQNAVELARVMFIGLDARGVVRLCNHEAERVTAFGRDELLGTRFVELLPEGPPYFAEEQRTDLRPEDQVAELIREKALALTRDEVPHAITVEVESIDGQHVLLENGSAADTEAPLVGAKVVTVGAAEVYGTELEIASH